MSCLAFPFKSSPHTKGWQSPRFCDYPQEIGRWTFFLVFQSLLALLVPPYIDTLPSLASLSSTLGLEVDSLSRFSKVQILSHQSKIAAKIELFVGNGPSYEQVSLLSSIPRRGISHKITECSMTHTFFSLLCLGSF